MFLEYFISTYYILLSHIYFPSRKFDILFCHEFSNWTFPFLSLPCPCLIHSRLFCLPSCLLLPPFCLVESLGFRHFSPSTMSLELKLGTGRSCGACCRPLGGGSNWCPCWPTYTRTTDLPCLVFCSCGWLLRGKVGDQAPSLKSIAKTKRRRKFSKHSGYVLLCRGVSLFFVLSCRGVSLFFVLSKP